MQLDIHARHNELKPFVLERIERQLRFGLTRFSQSIRKVDCAILDESGPRGAAAWRCKILILFRAGGQVTVDAQEGAIVAAAGVAADRAQRTVRRYLASKRQSAKYQRRRAASRLDSTSA